MNNNIKKEFENLMNDQAPDLWDRIEKSLPEKNNVTKKRSYKKYAAYTTVAAAACLCIVIFINRNHFSDHSENSHIADVTEEAMDSASEPDMTENAAAMEMAESDSGADSMDNAMYGEEEKFAQNSTASKELSDKLYDADIEEAADMEAAENMTESASGAKTEKERQGVDEKQIQSRIEELEEGGLSVFLDVSIRVDSITEESKEEKTVFIYHVTVLEDTLYLEKDTQLDFMADELFQDNPVEGESYLATFYDNKMPYDSSVHEFFLLKITKNFIKTQ